MAIEKAPKHGGRERSPQLPIRRSWISSSVMSGRRRTSRADSRDGPRSGRNNDLPVAAGEISPLVLKRATQRTALAMLTPKRLAAALRDRPLSTTACTTRSRRSSESAIPAAFFARRQSSSRSNPIRESRHDSIRSETPLARSQDRQSPSCGRSDRHSPSSVNLAELEVDQGEIARPPIICIRGGLAERRHGQSLNRNDGRTEG